MRREEKDQMTPKWPKVAATASWIAPLLAHAGHLMLRNTEGSVLIMGSLMLVLVVLGWCMGVLALSSVLKYGRKAILIPALIGTLISSFFLTAFADGFMEGKKTEVTKAHGAP